MKNYKIIIIAILALLAVPTHAQKGRRGNRGTKGKHVAAVAETAGQKLYKAMLPSTAKVMFIDSMVVGKADFLSHIALGQSAGKLSARQNISEGMPLTQYETDFADRRIYAHGDTAHTTLLGQTLLGDGWSTPAPLAGLSNTDYAMPNFPFLCADGVTLFFAAQGEHSMGGYDIFMTTYDTDQGTWYEPQNYGLPFNSTANDYLLAIDDMDSLGWLVSDRRQHKDSVCIYTFVPTMPRQDFSNEDVDATQLAQYADIQRIAETWPFGNRKAAMERKNKVQTERHNMPNANLRTLVINDQCVIGKESELGSPESRRLYRQWQELVDMLKDTRSELESKRNRYNKNAHDNTLTERIIQLEAALLQQQQDIKQIEKKIREIENRR